MVKFSWLIKKSKTEYVRKEATANMAFALEVCADSTWPTHWALKGFIGSKYGVLTNVEI